MLRRRTFGISIPKWKISDVSSGWAQKISIVHPYDQGALAAIIQDTDTLESWNYFYIDASFVFTAITIPLARNMYETIYAMAQWNTSGLIIQLEPYTDTVFHYGIGYLTFDANRVTSSRQSLPGLFTYYQQHGIAPHGTGCLFAGGWYGETVEDESSAVYYVDSSNVISSKPTMSAARTAPLGCRYKTGAVLCGRWNMYYDEEYAEIYKTYSLHVDYYDSAFIRSALPASGATAGITDVAKHTNGFVVCGIVRYLVSWYTAYAVLIEHYNDSGVKTQIFQSASLGTGVYDVRMCSVPGGVLIRFQSGALYFLDSNNVLTLLTISTGAGVAAGFGGHGIGVFSAIRPTTSQECKYIRLQ